MGRYFGALPKIAIAILLSVTASSCGESQSEKNGINAKNPIDPNTDIKPVATKFCRVTLDKDGRKSWELRGKRAQQVVEGQLYHIDQPVLVHFDDNEKKVLSSARGKLIENEKKVYLEGDVLLKVYKLEKPESDGPEYVVKTDKIFWHQKQGVIDTEAKVELLREGLRINGLGFHMKTNSNILEVKRNVSVTIEKGLGGLIKTPGGKP